MQQVLLNRLFRAVAVTALLAVPTSILSAQAATLSGRVLSESGQPLENANAVITELNISVGANAQGRYTITDSRGARSRADRRRCAFGRLVISRNDGSHAPRRRADVRLHSETRHQSPAGSRRHRRDRRDGAEENDVRRHVAQLRAGPPGQAGERARVDRRQGARRHGRRRERTPGHRAVHRAARREVDQRDRAAIRARSSSSTAFCSTATAPTSIPKTSRRIEVVKGAAGASLYGSRAQNGVISIKTKRASDAAPGLRIEARQEVRRRRHSGVVSVPDAHDHDARRNGHALLHQADAAFPTCSRTIDWDTEVLRINDVQTREHRSTRIRSSATTASEQQSEQDGAQGPVRGRISGRRCYNPVDRIKTNQPHLNSTVKLTGEQGATGLLHELQQLHPAGRGASTSTGYNRQTARANIDQKIGIESDDVAADEATRAASSIPDNFGWFGLTREHAAANLLGTRLAAAASSIARTSPPSHGIADDEQQPALLRQRAATAAPTRTASSARSTSHYNATQWLSFEVTTSIDERESQSAVAPRHGLSARSRRTTRRASAACPASASNNDLSYNMLLDGTATHNFGRDLTSRLDLRYTFEDQESNSVGGSGTHADARRPARPRQRDDVAESRATAGRRSAPIAVSVARHARLQGPVLLRRLASARTAARCSAKTSAITTTIARRSRGSCPTSRGSRLAKCVDQFKFRAAVGTAGARPRFSAQYEALTIGTGGSITANTLGNKDLRPENTLETEYGIDAELFHKYGLNITYARDITTDELLLVPPSVSSGFSYQWQNAGTMDGRTWEVSLNVPLIIDAAASCGRAA